MGHSEAYERMLRAARAGTADALYNLGVAYAAGENGLPVDLIAAHKWFNLAARAGDDRAPEDRAELAAEMSAWEVAEAQKQARAWLAAAYAPSPPKKTSVIPANAGIQS